MGSQSNITSNSITGANGAQYTQKITKDESGKILEIKYYNADGKEVDWNSVMTNTSNGTTASQNGKGDLGNALNGGQNQGYDTGFGFSKSDNAKLAGLTAGMFFGTAAAGSLPFGLGKIAMPAIGMTFFNAIANLFGKGNNGANATTIMPAFNMNSFTANYANMDYDTLAKELLAKTAGNLGNTAAEAGSDATSKNGATTDITTLPEGASYTVGENNTKIVEKDGTKYIYGSDGKLLESSKNGVTTKYDYKNATEEQKTRSKLTFDEAQKTLNQGDKVDTNTKTITKADGTVLTFGADGKLISETTTEETKKGTKTTTTTTYNADGTVTTATTATTTTKETEKPKETNSNNNADGTVTTTTTTTTTTKETEETKGTNSNNNAKVFKEEIPIEELSRKELIEDLTKKGITIKTYSDGNISYTENGIQKSIKYDKNGCPTSIIAGLKTTEISYNSDQTRQQKVVREDRDFSQDSYGTRHAYTTTTTYNHGQIVSQVKIDHDYGNRLKRIIRGESSLPEDIEIQRTEYSYNVLPEESNLPEFQAGNNGYTYDPKTNKVSKNNENWTKDQNDEVTYKNTQNGDVKKYDAQGRIIYKKESETNTVFEYIYDSSGNCSVKKTIDKQN